MPNQRVFIIGLFLLVVLQPLHAQEASDILNFAEQDYQAGRFDAVIERLNNNDELFTDFNETIQAHKLKAISYLALDQVEQSTREIETILSLTSSFEPDYNDPKVFADLVEQVRMGLQQEQITTISKKDENINLAAASFEIITHDQIRRRGYTYLPEMLHDLPGFDLSQSAGISYVNAYQRGYRSASNTDRTLFLVDGIEDNDLWGNRVSMAKQYALSNIKRVDILYGPASTMYGANAYTGVINIIQKKPHDIIKPGQHVGFTGSAGYGSFNSRYADFTLAGQYGRVAASLTARAFQSDENDLSSYTNWDYQWENFPSADQDYINCLSITADDIQALATEGIYVYNSGQDTLPMHSFVELANGQLQPTAAAIEQARNLDQEHYESQPNGDPLKFENPTEDYYLAGKLMVDDLEFGFQSWIKDEGAGPTYTDFAYAATGRATQWKIHQSFFYVDYERHINNKLKISNKSRYKIHGVFPGARITTFSNYGNGRLSLHDLTQSTIPRWDTTNFGQTSNEFKTEINVVYVASEKLDFIGGMEYRNSLIQGEYVKSSGAPSVYDAGIVRENIIGGNHYLAHTYSLFSQVTWQAFDQLSLTAGGRGDYNQIRQDEGYQFNFNPKLAAVFHHNNLILKAIYATAFKDASNYNRFSTSSARKLPPIPLKPEQVQNLEGLIRWVPEENAYLNLAVFTSRYDNVIRQAKDANGINYFINSNGYYRIAGAQVSGQYELPTNMGHYSFYGNYTFTHPYFEQDTVEFRNQANVRIADIASHKANLGLNMAYWDNRLSLNLRSHFVSEKPTGTAINGQGTNTTVPSNPLQTIDPYWVWHATLALQPAANDPLHYLRLQVTAKNIFNQVYYHPGVRTADGRTYASQIPQPGRHFMVSLFVNL